MHLTDATILSEEGSREVLEEMATPPEDTPQRRRAFALARLATELWKREGTVEEIPYTSEGGVLVLTPLPDGNDPIWELGKDAVVCGLPDASENHDRYLYETDL